MACWGAGTNAEVCGGRVTGARWSWRRTHRRAHSGRRPPAPAAREARPDQDRGRRVDPRLGVEDQPDGAGPGRFQGARRRRPAHALRRGRRAGAGGAAGPGAGGQRAELVAAVQRRHAELVPALPGPGGDGVADPHLRGPVRPGAAADRGVRPGHRPARPGRPAPGRDRPPGPAAPGAPAGAHPPRSAEAVGGHRRGGAAAPGRRRAGDARPARGADRHRHQDAARPAAGAAARRRRARRGRRRVHHPAVPAAGPARRGLPRAAHQRDVPGQARGRRPLLRRGEPPLRRGRAVV